MPNIVPCPSCQRQLSLPDEAAGKLVRCPQCNNTFTAPPAAGSLQPASPSAPPPVPRREDDYDDRDRDERRPRRRRFDDDDDRYGDIARRNMEPHRGALILTLAILGFVFCPMILGPIAWVMGNNDLKEIKAGRMDPSGEGITQAGRIIGMILTILTIVVLLLYCLIFIVAIGAGGLK